MINNIKRHLIPILILVIISILVHHVWFFNLSPITWGDWSVDSLEKIKEYVSLPRIWFADSGLGGLNFGISFWPFIFIAGILAKLNLNIYLVERLVFLWPIALFIPISMYLLTYYILRSKTAAFIGALVFEFNTYLIILKGGHLTLLMAITFTPVFLLFFIKTLKEKKLYYALFCTILGFIISFYEFRIFYLVCWLALFYTIYHLTIIERVKNLQQLLKLVIYSAIPIFAIISLNLYFLLGIYESRSLTSNSVFNQPLFGAWYIKLTKVFAILHFGWNGETAPTWEIQPMRLGFFFVPLLVFSGFIVSKKNKFIPFFGFLAILGIFLTKQNTVPFPDVYQWLFDRVPGFNAFRESGKFLLYETIAYGVLIGALIDWLWQRAYNRKNKIIALSITIITAMLFLWNAKPMITGGLGTLFVQRKMPNDYLIVNNFLSKQTDYFRTLWFPNNSRWSLRLNHIPIIGYSNISNADWLSFKDPVNQNKASNITNKLFDLSSIKYIFIPLEDKANEDNFFAPGTRKNIINQFDKLRYLNKIYVGTKEIVVYENKDFRPHIYLTPSKETIYKNIKYSKIDYKYLNPTEYQINLTNISSPVYLNFSDSYHPEWKVRVGEFNWFRAILVKNYFLPDKYHYKNDAMLNSFLIHPQEFCLTNQCIKNPNGSFDIKLTLYFQPQSYVYLGLIISGLTMLVCLGYLSLSLIRKNPHPIHEHN